MRFYQLNPPCKEAEAALYESSELSSWENECCEVGDTTDIMDVDPTSGFCEMEVDSDSDEESDDDGYSGGEFPFHTSYNYTTLQQLHKQKQKRKRNMLIPVTVNPTPTTISANSVTPRITKPRGFFRREPLSAPVMRLREKWKESVSARAETALWSGFEFGSGFGFRVIQTGTGFGSGSVGGAGSGRGPGQGQVRGFYRGREIGVSHGLPY